MAWPVWVLTWWRAALGFLVAAPLFFLLGQCDGRKSERAVQAAARAEANVQAMKTNAAATGKAADERVADAVTVSDNERALTDAIQDTPDSAPDNVRVALGCKRLREAGKDPAAFPACR